MVGDEGLGRDCGVEQVTLGDSGEVKFWETNTEALTRALTNP